MIEAALRDAGGSIARAATRIGWSRQKLYRRMDALAVRR
jgi:DNA-binding NtrC family response regulator